MNQVTCITKPHHMSPLEHITHVGGLNQNGGSWYYTREEVADMIDSGQYQFHVIVGRYNVPVTTYVRNGVKFLRTVPDQTTRDNLLSLNECSVRSAA
jgi:hypothetical protein